MRRKPLKSTTTKITFKERVPRHLKKKTDRIQHIKARLSEPLSLEERLKEAKAVSVTLEKDCWNWTASAERAAYLIAEDRLSLAQVAQKTGYSENRLKKWLRV